MPTDQPTIDPTPIPNEARRNCRWFEDNPADNILGGLTSKVITHRSVSNSAQVAEQPTSTESALYSFFYSQVELKDVLEAFSDVSWTNTMQE